MREIIDHLKLKEIDISMPRPRNLLHGHREIITYFRISDGVFGEYVEDFDDEDEENEDEDKPLKEYTEDCIHISTRAPMTAENSFRNRRLLTYTRREWGNRWAQAHLTSFS